MSTESLGNPLSSVYTIPGGQARLFERGVMVAGAAGEASLRFAFPMLGRPQFITGEPAAGSLFGPGALSLELGGLQLGQLAPLAHSALDGRVALLPTGQPPVAVPLRVGQAGVEVAAGALQDRRLYDVAVLGDGGSWQVVAPHAVYRRESWADFGVAHITDIHVARRIDSFRSLLAQAGRREAAQRMRNWNDRFRGFITYANYLHRIGVLDLVVATGDLVDYIFEDDDDQAGGGNVAFFRQLILGRAPGPEFPDVEELQVPILTVPGNHDYRKHPYKLICDLHLGGEIFGKDLARVKNFSGYHMLQEDAQALTNRLDGKSGSDVQNVGIEGAARMVEVDAAITAYRTHLADPGPYVARLGPHRIVMLDSAHDVGMVTDMWDGLRELLGMTSEDEATFVGGSPNSEGVSEEELGAVADALAEAPEGGLFMVGIHAPLFNVWGSEYPYYLRETQRPAQRGQDHGFLARHDKARLAAPVEEAIERRHPSWFAGPRDHRAPRFVKRVDSQDLMDYGVSRGRAEELMRLLAGVGSRRAADVVLSGHIHRHNEFRVRTMPTGELAYSMDFYTQNPGSYYPTPFTLSWRAQPTQPPTISPVTDTTYVEVTPGAAADATPWPMPYQAAFNYQLQVPPYANPLAAAADPLAWWSEHRPLVLQTGALGPLESSQVSFSGFRVLTVKNNIIDKIHFIASEVLEASQYRLPWEQAIRPASPRRYRYQERSRQFNAPPAVGAPFGLVFPAGGVGSTVYRDGEGRLHELWQRGDEIGANNLTAMANNATRAAGDPRIYVEGGTEVVLYRGADGHIHSLYWQPGSVVGHDGLSATARAPRAASNPVGYFGADGYNHVIYRSSDGHLHELWWSGAGSPGHGDLTALSRTPGAVGDPAAFANTSTGGNIVVYRGADAHIHTLYWSFGDIGHDNLSGVARSPRAAGDPVAYYTRHDDAHQVTYRGQDGHIHEQWWNGIEPVNHWDLSAAAGGAPPAVSDPAVYYSAGTNTKHVIYRSADNHLIEIWWFPGGGVPAYVDLTVWALAPLAADRPAAFTVDGPNSQHVVYRGADGRVHEIRWH